MNFPARTPVLGQKSAGKRLQLVVCIMLMFLSLCFFACKKNQPEPVVIWTNYAECASYAELFNKTHNDTKAVVVYKNAPARSLPPAQDELVPDVVIGPWLKNATVRRYFSSLDYLFEAGAIQKTGFYSQLLDYGVINKKQYLLPLSFNLPAVIFNAQYEDRFEDAHLITIDEMRAASLEFNRQNAQGTVTALGFAPLWSPDFLYVTSVMQGADYRQKGEAFSWNEERLEETVTYLREWSLANGGPATEQNFQFKYLYMPSYRQVLTGRSLFASVTSSELFTLSKEQFSGISFRWLSTDGSIMVQDSLVTMGIYKHAKNAKGAAEFLAWMCKKETQKALLERVHQMNLDTVHFGIAGGFSSLREVNTEVYPVFYRSLFETMPSEDYLVLPNMLQYRWASLQNRVIIPYLQEKSALPEEEASEVPSVVSRIEDWMRTAY